MPEVVAAPVVPVPAATQTPAKPVTPPAADAKAPPTPAETKTAEEFFELEIKGAKEKRSWSDPETRKLAVEAMQKKGYSEKAISDARTAHKAVEKLRGNMLNAVTAAQQGNPKALLDLLGLDASAASSSPEAVMKLLGVDPDAHARALLTKKLNLEGMTPDQRKIAELEAKAADYETKLKATTAERRQERVVQRAKMEQAQLFKSLSEAAERIGMAADERSLGAIHQVMEEMHRDGIPFVPDFIVQEAKDRIESGFKRLEEQTLKGLKGPALVQRLGSEVMKELRAHLANDPEIVKQVRASLIAKVRGGKPLDEKPAAPAPAANGAAPPKYITQAALDEEMRTMAKRHT